MCLAIPAQIVEIVDRERRPREGRDLRRPARGLVRPLPGGSRSATGCSIHVGFALERIDEEQARETLELLEQMGEAYEQELREIRESARAVTLDPEHCITCGDAAVAATVVGVDGVTATVELDGAHEQVGIELVEPVAVGDLPALPRRDRARETRRSTP